MEECGELAHAANKMWRVLDSDSGKVKEIIEAKHNLIKKMADVSIMIAQLQELLEVSDKRLVNEMNLKLDREIERIQKAM